MDEFYILFSAIYNPSTMMFNELCIFFSKDRQNIREPWLKIVHKKN